MKMTEKSTRNVARVEWQQTQLFSTDYFTHTHIQFGDLDSSCEGERANVLFALRELTNKWEGDIEYNPKQDKVQPINTTKETQPNLLQWRVWGVLVTGYNPAEPEERAMFDDLWSIPRPPNAILYQHLHGQVLFIRGDLLEEHNFRTALNTDPVLCSDSNEEVELILRDSAWEHTVKQDLEESFVHLWKTTSAGHKRLCGWIVDHDGTGGGVCHVNPKHLKDAFHQYLTNRNDFGYFDNTVWEGFETEEAAQAMIPILEQLTPRRRAPHT
jgi:hypothetical protein